jgi:hypothetical protein
MNGYMPDDLQRSGVVGFWLYPHSFHFVANGIRTFFATTEVKYDGEV